MRFQIVEKNEFYTLKYHPEHKIIHHEFHQYVHGDHFRNCLIRGLEIMRTYGVTKWLSDDRHNSALSQVDQEWSYTEWWPQAVALGWKYWAIVSPEVTVGKMAINRITKSEELQDNLVVHKFTTPEEALHWLIEQ